MVSQERTLTVMRQTGKEISTIFSFAIAEDDKSLIVTQLLALMRATPTGNEAHSARLMVLGALAAVGREIQPAE